MSSLGEELPKEIARVRDEVLPAYLSCGPGGLLAASLMRQDLDRASKAMIEGDVATMIKVYQALKEYQL